MHTDLDTQQKLVNPATDLPEWVSAGNWKSGDSTNLAELLYEMQLEFASTFNIYFAHHSTNINWLHMKFI